MVGFSPKLVDGVFRQWVTCVGIRPGEARYREAQSILDRYDALWREPDTFLDVDESWIGIADTGMMKAHGYEVRKEHGNSREARQWILGRIFERELAPLISAEYREAWGRPATGRRLLRMIGAIDFQTRRANKTTGRMDTALRRWKADREYLQSCLDTRQRP